LFANSEIHKPFYNSRAQGVCGKNKQPAQPPWRGAKCSRICCIGLRPALPIGSYHHLQNGTCGPSSLVLGVNGWVQGNASIV